MEVATADNSSEHGARALAKKGFKQGFLNSVLAPPRRGAERENDSFANAAAGRRARCKR
jgi:hypothetical protein